jgi:hypothetical protein
MEWIDGLSNVQASLPEVRRPFIGSRIDTGNTFNNMFIGSSDFSSLAYAFPDFGTLKVTKGTYHIVENNDISDLLDGTL